MRQVSLWSRAQCRGLAMVLEGGGEVGAPARCLPSTTGHWAAGGAITVPGMSQLPHWIQLSVSSLKNSI